MKTAAPAHYYVGSSISRMMAPKDALGTASAIASDVSRGSPGATRGLGIYFLSSTNAAHCSSPRFPFHSIRDQDPHTQSPLSSTTTRKYVSSFPSAARRILAAILDRRGSDQSYGKSEVESINPDDRETYRGVDVRSIGRRNLAYKAQNGDGQDQTNSPTAMSALARTKAGCQQALGPGPCRQYPFQCNLIFCSNRGTPQLQTKCFRSWQCISTRQLQKRKDDQMPDENLRPVKPRQ